jgi:hypothetical protein
MIEKGERHISIDLVECTMFSEAAECDLTITFGLEILLLLIKIH